MDDKQINVLLFCNEPVRGGVEEHLLLLLRGIDRNRFRPHLVCHPELVRHLEADLPEDVYVAPLVFEHPGQLGAAFRFARLLRTRRIHIVHSHLFRASLAASPVAWLCRVPLVMETPHVRELWRTGWVKGHFVIDRLVSRLISRYIAVSEANARHLIDTKKVPARKVAVIHNGCDLQRFHVSNVRALELRQRLGFAKNDPVLLTVARLEPQKGHAVLLEAFKVIRHEFPQARLVCVGSGSLLDELQEQANRLAINDSLRFVGYQPNVSDWLALADVSILSSFYEGLPLAAIESLAAERVVVATAVDGTPEVIQHEETGLTVPPGQPAALAAAVCRLLREPELRQRLARNGRERVWAEFSVERFLRSTQDFYLQNLEQRRRKRGQRQRAPVSAGAAGSN